jgi:hypothetical protein
MAEMHFIYLAPSLTIVPFSPLYDRHSSLPNADTLTKDTEIAKKGFTNLQVILPSCEVSSTIANT